MAIWLGRDGGIRLERTQSGPVYSYIRTDDVDAGFVALALINLSATYLLPAIGLKLPALMQTDNM